MNRFAKLLWTIMSYCPLFIVITVLLLVDFLTAKAIISKPWWIISFGALSVIGFAGSLLLLLYAKKKVASTSLNVFGASSKDAELMGSMIAYLLPLLTIVFNEVNQIALICFLVIIALMLFLTKAVYINPIICFIGYRYYSVRTESGMSYTLITRQKRFNPKKVNEVKEIFPEIYLEV